MDRWIYRYTQSFYVVFKTTFKNLYSSKTPYFLGRKTLTDLFTDWSNWIRGTRRSNPINKGSTIIFILKLR